MIIYGIFIPILVYIPILILKENAYLPILDFLDCEYAWLSVLKNNKILLSLNGELKIPNFFNGLPRKYIQSEFDLKRIFFQILPNFWGYILYSIIARMIGFFGIYFLLKKYYNHIKYKILLSASFSLLPVFTLYGISELGIPMLYFCLKNLYIKENILLSLIYIIFFPFMSHIAMIGPFIIIYLILYIVFQYKKINKYIIYAIILLFTSFMIANFNLILTFINGTQTNRNVKLLFDVLPSTGGFIYTFIKLLFFGNSQPANFISIPIWIMIFYLTIKKEIKKEIQIYLILIFLNTLIYCSITYININLFKLIPIFKSFDFSRIVFLNPFLYFLIFFETLIKDRRFNVYIILIVIILNIFSIPELSYNLFGSFINKNILAGIIDIDKPVYKLYNSITRKNKRIDIILEQQQTKIIKYKNFVSENLMLNISKYIGKPKNEYRIINLGIPPSISQINGFYTLDGDFDIYDAKYYKEFRKIIKKEIDKNKSIKYNYDYGGSQVFLYSSELVKYNYTNCYKDYNIKIKNLEINLIELKNKGCKYIFSAVEIINNEKIKFKKRFRDKISFYEIYLYEI